MTTAQMHCIVCDKTLEMFAELQPLGGLQFQTEGHYGSTFFDPMDGTRLIIAVCDPCLIEKKEYGHSEPKDIKLHTDNPYWRNLPRVR